MIATGYKKASSFVDGVLTDFKICVLANRKEGDMARLD